MGKRAVASAAENRWCRWPLFLCKVRYSIRKESGLDSYERKNKIKDEVTKIAVPKVCYYPILTGQECEEDKTVEELLKGLLKNILR